MNSSDRLIKEIEAILEIADQGISREQWDLVRLQLDRGIALIGDQYVSPDTIDSSDMMLVLSDIEAGAGKALGAAKLRRTVLSSRLEQLQHKLQAPGTPPTSSAPLH
ncbi:hypothetical protein SAMN05518845_10429 [Variovorax sp. YR750]|uniref:hypothetical protein n=1 Tax=Variovorax sp. YR750 TaxID=1884384 RepID=UPI0008AE4FAE|nr:hypothetical protein [Variovorax sp. YR750]SEK99390.1 hypothetical protein SAMN05518845_10429 [Variovorax sp. YR750]